MGKLRVPIAIAHDRRNKMCRIGDASDQDISRLVRILSRFFFDNRVCCLRSSCFQNADAVRAFARLSWAITGSSMRSPVGSRSHVLKAAEVLRGPGFGVRLRAGNIPIEIEWGQGRVAAMLAGRWHFPRARPAACF